MIDINFELPDYAAIFESHKDDIMALLAATMQTNRAMMFDKEGADNGKPKWAPLKWRSGMILQKRGTLRKSFAPLNDGIRPGRGQETIVHYAYPVVTIGTKLAYAKPLNDGATIRPKSAKALKIPEPFGGDGFIFRKKVTIPPRPMDVVTEQDSQEYATALENYITELLNNG